MNERDDVLLEYLESIYPSAEPVTTIHWNIHEYREDLLEKNHCDTFSKNTARNRLKKLEDVSFVEISRETHNYRRITEEGMQYLRGDRGAPELDD